LKKHHAKKKADNVTYIGKIKAPQVDLQIKQIKPLTTNQQKTFEAFQRNKNLLLHGLAGTGKTFMSLFLALENITKKNSPFYKVVIVRSVVPTRDIGFLPGNEHDKTRIYEGPYKAISSELYGRDDAYEILKHHKIVEFITTSFIRGTTINNAIVIVDEAQNMTGHELDSVITRIGSNCRVVICGDFRQSDLVRQSERDGLQSFMSIVKKLEHFVSIEFEEDDIVRSGFVKEYIIQKTRMGIKL
jgi:phosphate starvation-inducible PhoH-like protein